MRSKDRRQVDLNVAAPAAAQIGLPEPRPEISLDERTEEIALRKAKFGSCVLGFSGSAARVLDQK